MGGFAAIPQELRDTASDVDAIDGEGTGAPTGPNDVGHAGLRAAAAEFATYAGTEARAHAGATSALASGLRSTAELYETADATTPPGARERRV